MRDENKQGCSLKESYARSNGSIPPGTTACQFLDRAVTEAGEHTALIFNEERIFYADLVRNIFDVAAVMLQLGIRRGDKVAILMPNCPDLIYLSQAAMLIGAVKVEMHVNFREVEIRTTLAHSESKAAFFVEEYAGYSFSSLLSRIRDGLPYLEHVVIKGGNSIETISFGDLIGNISDGERIVRSYLQDNRVDSNDLAAILYTSGTTGTPKGVMHTQNSLYRLAISSNTQREVTQDEVWLGMLPLSSAFGIQYMELCPIISESTLVLMESFDPLRALELIDKYKATSPIGVPTMFIRMLKHPSFSQFDVSSLRKVYLGGAAGPRDMMHEIYEKLTPVITMTYGSSEEGHATMTNVGDSFDRICDTSGGPIWGGAEVKIVSDDGKVARIGEIGEIYSRSFGTALGYYRDPERTKLSFDGEGWVHVGDLGIMDECGYVKVVGRKKDVVIRGGHNVYPDEIESLLYRHHKIGEVSIVGYPDPELGERTCAFIVLRVGHCEIARDEIVAFLADKVARYKIPDKVVCVDSFPLTATGKIQKHRLRDLLLD